MIHAYGEQICDNAGIWSHINGWEVVAAILFVVTAWTVVNVARFYFMVEIGKVKTNGKEEKET